MLKITSQQDRTSQDVSLVIEGRLAGPLVEELRAYCRVVSANQQQCKVIDLTGVTFIDASGKALLASLWQQGAELQASGCLTKCVVEEITGVDRRDSSTKNCDQRAPSTKEDEV